MAVSSSKARLPELLERYAATHDINTRNEIVLMNLDTVKIIAYSMRNIFSGYAETDDVINEGVIALMAAIDGFDSSKGVKFETYAGIKIRGSIIDYMRRLDRVPRQLRKLSKEIDTKFSQLNSELGRAPTNEELADSMNLTIDQLNRVMANAAGMITLSFEELLYEDNIDEGVMGHSETADAKMYEKERREIIAKAIQTLPEKERQVITMYYYEQLKYSEIAEVIGVTQSRICQIHSKAMLTLKARLESYIKN